MDTMQTPVLTAIQCIVAVASRSVGCRLCKQQLRIFLFQSQARDSKTAAMTLRGYDLPQWPEYHWATNDNIIETSFLCIVRSSLQAPRLSWLRCMAEMSVYDAVAAKTNKVEISSSILWILGVTLLGECRISEKMAVSSDCQWLA